MRTPLTVIAVLIVVLLGMAFVADDEQPAAPPAAPVDVIARRVEALRHLRFEQLPKPLEVDPAQARREGLEDLDRGYPAKRRRRTRSIYKLLGLIEADADLRELSGSLFGEGVAGYYDPRDGRLRVVTAPARGSACWRRWCSPTSSPTRSRTSGSGSRPTPGPTIARWRGGAARGDRDRADVRVRRRPLHDRGDARRAARLGVRGHRRPAAVPGGSGAVPLRRRRAVRQELLRRAGWGAGRHGVRGPPALLDRADPPSGRLLRRRRAAAGPDPRAVLGGGWTRRGRHVGGAADARAARAARRAQAAGLGRRPLRAVAPRRRRRR